MALGLGKVQLRGRNGSFSTSAATVWSFGNATYAQLTSGTALEVLSSSANDAAAGTGARTIRVSGVDSAYTPFTETITLNGVTPVALANTSVIGVNAMEVLTVGSGTINAGAITCRTVSGSVNKCRIDSNAFSIGRSAEFIYTIPASMKGNLKSITVTGTGITGDLTAYIYSWGTTGIRKIEGFGKSSLYVTAFNGAITTINFGDGLWLPEKTLIELRCILSAGTGDIVAMGDLDLYAA